MNERPILLVLEDMEVRVEWLKERFPDAEIVWETSVDGFLTRLKTIEVSRVVLFLLDHDLGGPFEGSVDVAGKSGHDATRAMKPWSDIPAIVWSINAEGASNMIAELTDFGFIAAWIPFTRGLLHKLEAAIRSQVSP